MQISYIINTMISFITNTCTWSYTNVAIHTTSSGGSRNLRTVGHGPGAVLFFMSEDCFDAPWHIPYAFVVRVGNKTNIVNIAFWFQ